MKDAGASAPVNAMKPPLIRMETRVVTEVPLVAGVKRGSAEYVAKLEAGMYFFKADLVGFTARMPLSFAAYRKITELTRDDEYRSWLTENTILLWVVSEGPDVYGDERHRIYARLNDELIDRAEAAEQLKALNPHRMASGRTLLARNENELFAFKMRWL